MLDVKNPEIRVDEIMQRIQQKVRLRKEAQPVAIAQPGAPAPAAETSAHVAQHLARAREYAHVGAALPAMSKTTGVKRAVAEPLAKGFLRLAQLITRDQRQFNDSVLDALQAVSDKAHGAEALAREGGPVRQELSARIGELAGKLQELTARSTTAASQAQEQAAALTRRIDELEARLKAADHALASERQAHAASLGQVRTAVALQDRRLSLLLEEAKKRLPKELDEQQLKAFADELPHVEDAKYLSFEDAFRGAREDIKQRVAIYVPRLREAGAGSAKAPIVDLGCGRGELLEVLKAEGLEARGVDSNSASVEVCRSLGLDVTIGNLFETLAKTADGALGAVTALHVVEHLPFELLLKLLDETVRVLRPGGVAIFESPNPQNLLVGATNFYLDPTHRNPVHPQTLHYLCEARGLIHVETLPLHPFPKEMHVPESESVAARIINQYFFGPQDYAVLGRRP